MTNRVTGAGGAHRQRPRAGQDRKHVRARDAHEGAAHRRIARRAALFQQGHRHRRLVRFRHRTYGNSVLDLQSNKVDLAFALNMAKDIAKIWDAKLEYIESNPLPQRALAIGFTRPMIVHPFGCVARKGFEPKTWDDRNKPDIRVVCDLGSLHEVLARRFAPKAQITAYKTRDEGILAMQGGRGDADILAAMLGITALAKNPGLGTFRLLGNPPIALPSCMGIQREPDTRFVEVVNAWLDMNRGTGQIREWMINAIIKAGARPEDIPTELSF